MNELRPVKSDDAPALRALYLALLRGTFTNFPPAAIESYAADWTPELIAARVMANRFVLLGAFQEGIAEGLLFGAPPEIAGVGTVIWLGIADNQRGQGLGSGLMRLAADEYRARSCHKIKIYTESEAARDFYVKLGMAVEGFHPLHWWQMDFWSLGMQI